MNWLLLSRMLGMLGVLIGGSMAFSLPWSFPALGQTEQFESRAFVGMLASIVCSIGIGTALYRIGRNETGTVLRREALAIVGLGWILAGVLGALPYLFTGTLRAPETPVGIADALFESASGFTTTGASVLTGLEADDNLVPRCVLFLAQLYALAGRDGNHCAFCRHSRPARRGRQSADEA